MKNLFKRAALAALTLTLAGNGEMCAMEKTKALIGSALETMTNHKKKTIAVGVSFYLLQVYRAASNGNQFGPSKNKDEGDLHYTLRDLASSCCNVVNNNINNYFFRLGQDLFWGCYYFVCKPTFFGREYKKKSENDRLLRDKKDQKKPDLNADKKKKIILKYFDEEKLSKKKQGELKDLNKKMASHYNNELKKNDLSSSTVFGYFIEEEKSDSVIKHVYKLFKEITADGSDDDDSDKTFSKFKNNKVSDNGFNFGDQSNNNNSFDTLNRNKKDYE